MHITVAQAEVWARLPFQRMFGQSLGAKARGKPGDTQQTTVYTDLTSLRAQYKWFRLAQDQKWLETIDCSSTYLTQPMLKMDEKTRSLGACQPQSVPLMVHYVLMVQ